MSREFGPLRARRQLLWNLLSAGVALDKAVEEVSEKSGCSRRTAWHVFDTIGQWYTQFCPDLHFTQVVIARLELLNRKSLNILADEPNPAVALGAIKSSLKINMELVGLGQNSGFLGAESQPAVAAQDMPYEACGEIMEAYRRLANEQKEEKNAQRQDDAAGN
jgi:hypothetical protein